MNNALINELDEKYRDYTSRSEYDKAINVAKQIIELDPFNFEMYTSLLGLYQDKYMLDEIVALKKVLISKIDEQIKNIKANLKTSKAVSQLTLALNAKKDYYDTEGQYDKILEVILEMEQFLPHKEIEIWWKIGYKAWVLSMLGRGNEALELLKATKRKFPENYPTLISTMIDEGFSNEEVEKIRFEYIKYINEQTRKGSGDFYTLLNQKIQQLGAIAREHLEDNELLSNIKQDILNSFIDMIRKDQKYISNALFLVDIAVRDLNDKRWGIEVINSLIEKYPDSIQIQLGKFNYIVEQKIADFDSDEVQKLGNKLADSISIILTSKMDSFLSLFILNISAVSPNLCLKALVKIADNLTDDIKDNSPEMTSALGIPFDALSLEVIPYSKFIKVFTSWKEPLKNTFYWKKALAIALATLYFKSGEYLKAVKEYKEYIKFSPLDKYRLLDIAKCYYKLGKSSLCEKSINEYFDFIAKSERFDKKNHAEYLNRLITIYKDFGDKEKCIEIYDELIKINPLDYENYKLKARLYKDLDRIKEAIRTYEDFLAVKGDKSEENVGWANYLIGLRYQDLDKMIKALVYYDEAIEHFKHGYFYYAKGQLLRDSGHFQEALDSFKVATELIDYDADIWLEYGNLLLHFKEYDNAREMYKRVIKISPTNSAAYNNISETLILQHKFAEALEMYDKGLSIDSQNPYIWEGIGYANWKLGNTEKMKAAYTKAIKYFHIRISEGRAISTCWMCIGKIYSIFNEKDKATEALKNAIAKNSYALTQAKESEEYSLVFTDEELKQFEKFNS